jgi:integrase
MENKIDILFYARSSKKTRKGLTPIYGRLVVNGERWDFATGFSIEEESWNSRVSKVTGNSEAANLINNYISLKKIEVSKLFNQLLLEDKAIDLLTFKNRLMGIKEDEDKTIMELIDFHNAEFKARLGTDTSYSTFEKYEITKLRVSQFLKDKYQVKDKKLKDLKLVFISGFQAYLISKFKNKHNTIAKYCKNLKTIMNFGVLHEWLEVSPFAKFKIGYKDTDKIFLTKQELAAIESKELKQPRLDLIRDLFIFQCYTGLAYIDMKNLLKSEIQIGIDGNRWIIKRRVKTDQRSAIPLLPKAIEILEKYSWQDKKDSEAVLPVYSNQKINSYLEEIADLCEISKKITSHVGRRTFATTIGLGNNIPIETISKMLGHSNTKMTQQYAMVTDTKISQDMQALKDKLYGQVKK